MDKGKKMYYYKLNDAYHNEFVKKILDFDVKEESYVVISFKPKDGAKCSVSLYDMTGFMVTKQYEKSNETEFNEAYDIMISNLN